MKYIEKVINTGIDILKTMIEETEVILQDNKPEFIFISSIEKQLEQKLIKLKFDIHTEDKTKLLKSLREEMFILSDMIYNMKETLTYKLETETRDKNTLIDFMFAVVFGVLYEIQSYIDENNNIDREGEIHRIELNDIIEERILDCRGE